MRIRSYLLVAQHHRGEVHSQEEIPHSAAGLSLNMEYKQRHSREFLKGTGTHFQQGGATKTRACESSRAAPTARLRTSLMMFKSSNIPSLNLNTHSQQHL